MTVYRVPAAPVRVELEISRSRFITSLSNVAAVEIARAAIAAVRAEMPDASHHVYAFKVGYGGSVVEGLSDDGEPTGTAGPPVLAVLRGAEVGDTLIVVTRYFGGTKLGTGGLVRAYGDSARAALTAMTTVEKVEKRQLGLTAPYHLYERLKLLATAHAAIIDDEDFEVEVTLYLTLPITQVESFTLAVRELSAGRITLIEL